MFRHPAFYVAIGAAVVVTAGCQTVYSIGSEDPAGYRRGLEYARDNCSECHALTRTGSSPRATAPSFGDISRRYSGIGLERELEAISQVGHYEMDPITIGPADIRDLTAYIQGL